MSLESWSRGSVGRALAWGMVLSSVPGPEKMDLSVGSDCSLVTTEHLSCT